MCNTSVRKKNILLCTMDADTSSTIGGSTKNKIRRKT